MSPSLPGRMLCGIAALVMVGLQAACGGSGAGSADGGTGGGGLPGGGPGSATVSWNASPDADVAGYRVYVGTRAGSYDQARGAGFDAGTATSFVVNGLASGRTYYFSVTAYDAAGNESGFAVEASKQLP